MKKSVGQDLEAASSPCDGKLDSRGEIRAATKGFAAAASKFETTQNESGHRGSTPLTRYASQNGDSVGKNVGARAFLTGSQVYGKPGSLSDIDLVILTDQATLGILTDFAVEAVSGSGGEDVSASLRFGKLNLIVHTDEREFNAWRDATNKLIARRPVSRDEAVALIKGKAGR